MPLSSITFWKALSAVLLLIVLAQQFIGQPQWVPKRIAPSLPWARPTSSSDYPDTWEYSVQRDRYNHGLSSDQCQTAFPGLFKEIDRAVSQWKDRQITAESIQLVPGNDGNVRMMIYNQQLRIISTKGLGRDGFHFRILSVINQIRRALTAAEANDESLPDIEFNIVVDDIVVLKDHHDDRALWSWNRESGNKVQDNVWLIPDYEWFAGVHQGSFRDMQTRSRAYDSEIKDKIPKVVWRGAIWTNPAIRNALIHAVDGEPWADVEAIEWAGNQSNILEIEEFCKYAFFVNTEGRAWSGRLTLLLNCDSVPIVHDPQWIAHYYHLLEHGVNCVHAERNFTDLGEKITYYLDHPEEAQAIADKSVETFRDRYTSPAATSCYWRELFRGWSTVSFTPELYEPASGSDTQRKMRGISYDDFILHVGRRDYPWPDK